MRPIPSTRAASRIWILNLCVVAASGLTFLLLRSAPSYHGPVSVPAWLVAALFCIAELFIVHLEIRRDAHSFSLSEVPLVLALFLVSPATLMAAQVAGITAAFALRRQSAEKLVFNVASNTLCGGLAALIFASVAPHSGLGPAHWGAALLAVLPTVALCACLINLAMKLSGAEQLPSMRSFVVFLTVLISFTNVSIALAAVTIMFTSVWAMWLLLVPLAMMFVTYRAYTSQRQRHQGLEVLYKATRVVDRSVKLDSGTAALLQQAREMFRAEVAQLTLFPEQEGGPALRTSLGPGDQLSTREPVFLEPTEGVWARVAAERQALLFARPIENERLRDHFAERGIRDAMVAPLYRDNDVVGVLLVGNRLGDVSTFDEDDLKLFTTLANHASVSLENAHLVEDLSESLEQLRELNRRNEHQANHDSLTGLPNRSLFHKRARACVESSAAASAVMMLDLDRFKEVNDSLGHQNGDLLLRQVAERLQTCLREDDTVARLGGDEFAVLLPNVAEPATALTVAREIQAALGEPLIVAGLNLSLEASVGIALHPLHGNDVHELMRMADVAMYAAKERETGIEVYAPGHDPNSSGRLALIGDLRRAIDEGTLELHYQPKMRISDEVVTGVEALVRWNHPERGAIRPDEFIPIAETSGLVKPLTLWVLNEALRQCREWQERGLDLKVAVNLSAKNLIDVSFAEEVADLLARWHVSSSRLDLEITESTIMTDPNRARGVLAKLHGMGIGLSIDDFGTGYSSLGYLKQLPVDELKIDKSFVLNMSADRSDAAIVRSTVELGRNLGLQVVAEGVEDENIWAQLDEMGCHLAQGYHLSRPLPASALEDWMNTGRRVAPLGKVAAVPDTLMVAAS